MRGTLGGALLLGLAALMLLGFLRSTVTLSSPAALTAVIITVVLPAVGGLVLLSRRFRAGARLTESRSALRRQTLDSEILRLAARHDGRLTLVEVVQEMAVPSEEAQAALDGLVHREVADLAVTDSGTLVYTFRDIERRGEKAGARHVLE